MAILPPKPTQWTLSAAVLLSLSSSLPADPVLNLKVTPGNGVTWQGQIGHVYFVQWSLDLIDWEYVPVVYTGSGPLSWPYTGTATQIYCRVKSVYAPNVNPNSDDFDDDGISNLAELTYQINNIPAQLDPLNPDTDGDGFADGTELTLGTDPSVRDHAVHWSGTTAIVLTPTTP